MGPRNHVSTLTPRQQESAWRKLSSLGTTLLLLTWLLPAGGASSAEHRYFFEPVESAASATQVRRYMVSLLF